MTLKEMRELAENFGKVESREQLKGAVPIVVETMEKIRAMRSTIKVVEKIVEKLNDKVSKYALEHPSAFDDGLKTMQNDVICGDLEINGVTYHFASGYGSPKRVDGDALTQEFLEGLPKEWVKASLQLDTTGINRSGATYTELSQKGLFRPAKNNWSVKTETDFGADDYSD